MITINDVAKKCGVAKSTVSNALTDKKYVSPDLKKKIMDACKELDFQPNFYASTLSRGRTNIVALVLEEDSDCSNTGASIPTSSFPPAYRCEKGKTSPRIQRSRKSSVLTMLKRDKAPIDGAVVMTPLVDDARFLSSKNNVSPASLRPPRRGRRNQLCGHR